VAVLAHFKKEVGLKEVERGLSSSLSAGLDAFEKMKCIFSIVAEENFGEAAGVFLTKKHSPDAVCEGVGHRPSVRCVLEF
jgi:hypothetical protein